MSTKIVMYESMLCGYCRAAKRMLDSKGWEYEAIGVDGKPDIRQEMQNRSGRTSVPQIFFDDHHVGGFDDMAELEADGKLDALYQA
jgi:glutaredoxin 3